MVVVAWEETVDSCKRRWLSWTRYDGSLRRRYGENDGGGWIL